MDSRWKSWAKVALIVATTIYGVVCALDYEKSYFIHGVDLLIHESGHMIFGIFGNQTLMIMGGTLLQLIMPLLFVGYFFFRKEWYSTAVTGWWFGQNFFDVAVYIRDARALALPLVGIGTDDPIHDWNYLLFHWHVLARDQQIANLFAGIGWIIFFVVFIVGCYFAFPHDEEEIPPPPVLHDYDKPITNYLQSEKK